MWKRAVPKSAPNSTDSCAANSRRASEAGETVLYPTIRLYNASDLRLNQVNHDSRVSPTREEGMPSRVATRMIAAPAALAMLIGLAPGALAQDKTFELKLSHWVPPTHPLQKAMEDWGSSIEKASNGTIKYKVFPAQQLGKAFDHYDMARDGIADLTYINPGYQPGRFPIIAAGELPFMIGDAKVGTGRSTTGIANTSPSEMKDVKYCFAFILRSRRASFQDQEDRGAGRPQGNEDPPVARHHGGLDALARRHQRAGRARRKCAICSRRAWWTR